MVFRLPSQRTRSQSGLTPKTAPKSLYLRHILCALGCPAGQHTSSHGLNHRRINVPNSHPHTHLRCRSDRRAMRVPRQLQIFAREAFLLQLMQSLLPFCHYPRSSCTIPYRCYITIILYSRSSKGLRSYFSDFTLPSFCIPVAVRALDRTPRR